MLSSDDICHILARNVPMYMDDIVFNTAVNVYTSIDLGLFLTGIDFRHILTAKCVDI